MKFLSKVKPVLSAVADFVRRDKAVRSVRSMLRDHYLTISGLSLISASAYMHNHILGVLTAGLLIIVFNERAS